MKIWIAGTSYGPDLYDPSGYFIHCLTEALSENYHDIRLFLPHDKFREHNPPVGVKISPFSFSNLAPFFNEAMAGSFALFQEIERTIRAEGSPPEIIEFVDSRAPGYFLLKNKWTLHPLLQDTATVLNVIAPTYCDRKYNQQPGYVFPEYWLSRLEQFCRRAADGVIFSSEALAKSQEPEKFFQNVVRETIHPPYRPPRSRVFRNHRLDRQPPKPFDILFVGGLEGASGLFLFLKHLEKLWEKKSPIRAAICGPDSFFQCRDMDVSRYIEKKYSRWIETGLMEIHVTGSHEKLDLLLERSELACLPHLSEKIDFTGLHAMAKKSKILISRSGALMESFGDDSSVISFDWNLPGDFESRLNDMLDRRNFADKSGLATKKWSYGKVVGQRESFYRKLLRAQAPRSLYPVSLRQGGHESRICPRKQDIGSEKGLLSVVIPYFNTGEYIDETLDSIASSDYPNIEIILIDDGSDDYESIRKITEIQQRNINSLKIFQTENQGLANARNTGVREASGEFVAFLDSDDKVHETFFSKAVRLLQTYENISFVYSWVRYFGESDDTWVTHDTQMPFLLIKNMLCPMVTFRKEDFEKAGMQCPELIHGLEDHEGWLSMVLAGMHGVSLPEVLTYYRVRSDSMFRGISEESFCAIMEQISGKHKKAYKEHALEIFHLLYSNHRKANWDNPGYNYFQKAYGSGPTGFSKLFLQDFPVEYHARTKVLLQKPSFVFLVKRMLGFMQVMVEAKKKCQKGWLNIGKVFKRPGS